MNKIKEIIKKKGQYEVVLETDQRFFVTEKTLINHHLYKGKSLEETTVKTLQEIGKYDQYYAKALAYTTRQLRTKKEVITKLKESQLSNALTMQIIDELTLNNHVDDERYVALMCDEWIHFGLNGPKLIAQKLKQKGIPAALVNRALESYTIDLQRARLLEDLEKLATYPIRKPYYKAKQAIINKYLRKGFDAHVIRDTLASHPTCLNQAIDELPALLKVLDMMKQRYPTVYLVKQALMKKGFSSTVIENHYEEDADE